MQNTTLPNSPIDIPSAPSKAVLFSFLAIMATEIGDKTFLITAILAMKNPRLTIFLASISALGIMTVLSALLGQVVTTFISKRFTQFLAAILFIVFGLKMIKESREMTGDETKEEMEEVHELLAKENGEETDMSELESGLHRTPSSPKYDKGGFPFIAANKPKDAISSFMAGFKNLMSFILSPIFVQTFTLTFLAEWGDRSQIATIAMAGSEDWIKVSISSIAAHSICTGLAVIGGSMLAEKISVKTVTFVGAILFLFFGVIAFYEAYMLPN